MGLYRWLLTILILALNAEASVRTDPRVGALGYELNWQDASGRPHSASEPSLCKVAAIDPSIVITALHCVLVFKERQINSNGTGSLFVANSQQRVRVTRAFPVQRTYVLQNGLLDFRQDLAILFLERAYFENHFELQKTELKSSLRRVLIPEKGTFQFPYDLEVAPDERKTTAKVIERSDHFRLLYASIGKGLGRGDSGYPIVDPLTGELIGIFIAALDAESLTGRDLPDVKSFGVVLKLGPHVESILQKMRE